MQGKREYLPPQLFVMEVEVETGFSSSLVEVPPFEEEEW